MKLRTLLLSLATLLSIMQARADVTINETNFPDENFRNWLLEQDYGSDGVITDTEIAGITGINIYGRSITNLMGIEFFTALESLYCSGNQLTSLDVSKNTALIGLGCYDNQLTSLNVSGCTALKQLDCQSNQLTSLDVSGCTELTTLWCYSNKLTSLDVSKNTALTMLWCNNNQLTSLDVSGCPVLESLYCQSNQLISLEVSGCTTLKQLYCYKNQLASLDVSGCTVLEWLDCQSNQLTSLDVSRCTALTILKCNYNQIKGSGMDALVESLPNVSNGWMYVIWYENEGNVMTTTQVAAVKAKGWTPYYTNNGSSWKEYAGSDSSGIVINETNFPDENFRNWLLEQVYDSVITDVEIAGITRINISGRSITSLKGIEFFTALTTLDCSNNQLTSLDVSKNTALTLLICDYNQLTSLDVSKNTALTTLWCYNNQLTSLDVSKNTALKKLKCSGNQLTSLDVSGCTALTELYCYYNLLTSLNVSGCTALTMLSCNHNQIKSSGMDALVESLPNVSKGDMLVIWCENEGNVMTTTQVAAVKAKGWTPYYTDDGRSWKEYAGSDPSGIEELKNSKIKGLKYYDLQGHPVKTPNKGVYVINGKKVLMK